MHSVKVVSGLGGCGVEGLEVGLGVEGQGQEQEVFQFPGWQNPLLGGFTIIKRSEILGLSFIYWLIHMV